MANGRSSGRFISFEGIDGSGKSTQARSLVETLRSHERPATLTREPGGSAGAEAIRRLLVEGEPGRWSAETEILLFTAARRDHLERLIQPAIAGGDIVVCDRFADSTRIYQGTARADLREVVDRLHDLMIGTEPDLTLIIDMDPDVALARGLARRSGEDRFEEMGHAFQVRLAEGFRALAKAEPERCRLIDGRGTSEDVAARIWRAVEPGLP